MPREVIERALKRGERDEPVEGDPEAIEWFWVFPTLEGEHASLSQPAERSSGSTPQMTFRNGAV